jgi:annexin-like protein
MHTQSDRANRPDPSPGVAPRATSKVAPSNGSSVGPDPAFVTPSNLRRIQASAGNRATAALVAQRLTIQRAISTEQADSIARQLEDAMSGWGTDEEAIYGALSGRTAPDITKIKESYQRLFNEDLDAELRDELNDSELARVSEMMPTTEDESTLSDAQRATEATNRARVVASQIRDAVAGLGTEEAQIYNSLTGRTSEELNEIQRQYLDLTGRDVILDLRSDMSGGELTKALHLFEVASAGTFENTFEQNMTEGETTVGHGLYNYALHPDRLDVDVPIKFKPDAGVAVPFALWNGQIDSTWNKFALTEPGGRKVPINMKMRDDPGADREVVVHNNTDPANPLNDRANAGEFYLVMKADTVPHEFGHFLGLEDEYQRYHSDITRLVGAPAAGPANASGKTPLAIAKELHAALYLDDATQRAPAATTVLTNVGLIVGGAPQQGDFAQSVKSAYDDEYGGWFTKNLVKAMRDKLPERTKWTIQTVFSYASRSLMGDPGGLGGAAQPHDHAVEARHLRNFVNIARETWPDFVWTVGPK